MTAAGSRGEARVLAERVRRMLRMNDDTVTAMIECTSTEAAIRIAEKRGSLFGAMLDPLRDALAKWDAADALERAP